MNCCSTPNACHKKNNVEEAKLTVALVGNPNCGKTTLFNALTGARQRVGNWPGVTVERKTGFVHTGSSLIELIDLPGIYSLSVSPEQAAIDENIACHFILENNAHVLLNVVDASHLERHLYLTVQLLEMGLPIVLALNMMDMARDDGIEINAAQLSKELGCPVVKLEANKGEGIAELRKNLSGLVARCHCEPLKKISYPAAVQTAIDTLNKDDSFSFPATLLLEDPRSFNSLSPVLLQKITELQQNIHQEAHEDADILIADARYQFIQRLIKQCVTHSAVVKTSWTNRIDKIVLNRFAALPIFLGVMYLLFFFAINIGGAFQDFFDIATQTIFVDGLGYVLNAIGLPIWLTALLANGVGKGINTTLTFIPVIGSMFLFLALLEDSGYMARAAFVIDRFMRVLGLPGKAFVPMIVGFGCNVPAVMGARTLENQRDRILTILMSPFMSCGARLAIFAVFTAAFFPRGSQNVVFALYLVGILMAIMTGFMMRKTLLRGDPSPLVMELPAYHLPNMRTLLLHAWQRLKGFVFRAGKLIVPICILIGALNTINLDGSINTGDGDVHSLLSSVGRIFTPLFAPMGIHNDNWPATVGLVTGVLAKEVVVGTLNTLYTQVGHFAAPGSDAAFHFWSGIKEALQSIPDNFAQLSNAFSNPVLAKAPVHAVNQGVYGLMYQQFDGQAGAFAYLLFVLLYFPCISTTAVMLRELHRGWAIFSAIWMTGVAYGTAVAFYQAATWAVHPLSSSLWIAGIGSLFFATIFAMRWYTNATFKTFAHTNNLTVMEKSV